MLKYKKDFNFYLLWKFTILGDKSRNMLATKTTLNFRRPRSKKLSNHSMCSNWHISEKHKDVYPWSALWISIRISTLASMVLRQVVFINIFQNLCFPISYHKYNVSKVSAFVLDKGFINLVYPFSHFKQKNRQTNNPKSYLPVFSLCFLWLHLEKVWPKHML